MIPNPLDVEAAIRQLGKTEAEQAFAKISIANRMARGLPPPPQYDESLTALYKWYSDPNTKASEKVASIPEDLALRLSDAVLRLAAREPQLVPRLTEAIAEQAKDDRAAVREPLGRAVAVSLILLVVTTAFDAHGASWAIHHSIMSDDVLRGLVSDLAKLIGVAGQ